MGYKIEVIVVVVGDSYVAKVVLNNTDIDKWSKGGKTTHKNVNKGTHE